MMEVTMSVPEYAKRVNIGRNNMRKMTHIDGFPVLCIGRRRLILVEQADKWIVSHANEIR